MRQDDFTVRCGRHKSLRRIFLFEDLLLFSKPRRGPSGTDTFTYKRSFKVGLPNPCALSQPPQSLTSSLSWSHRWQISVSLSALGRTTCTLRSGSAVERPGTLLCCRLPAWPPSRHGRLTSPVCSGSRQSTTRVGTHSSHPISLPHRGPRPGCIEGITRVPKYLQPGEGRVGRCHIRWLWTQPSPLGCRPLPARGNCFHPWFCGRKGAVTPTLGVEKHRLGVGI